MKILVADDDATSRLIVQTALRSLGHECHTVCDGAQAWDLYRALEPDVVISDWKMPGLSGLELCREIRTHPVGDYAYFIMVTNERGADEIIEGMSAGADDYLLKPLDADDLAARLVAAARLTSLHHQLASQQAELEQLNTELAAVARRDPLTELGNRRALDEDLEQLEARMGRYGGRFCMGLLDVDHFKSYNDRYGHQAGDRVLEIVAGQLRAQARERRRALPLRRRRVPVRLPGAIAPERGDRGGAHANRRRGDGHPSPRQPARRAHDQRRNGDSGSGTRDDCRRSAQRS